MTKEAERILVVDDEPGILTVYKDLLSPASSSSLPRSSRGPIPEPAEPGIPCTVLTARSGEEAIRIAMEIAGRGEAITCCFMDMRMPGGIDGLETAKRLRAIDPRILVTFVTAYHDRSLGDIRAAFSREAQDDWDFLNKPFTRAEILQRARNMFADWNRRRANESLVASLTEANESLRKRTEDLQAARDELVQAEKLAAVGSMAAGLAHEMNNPLTSIIGYMHLALRSRDLNFERARLERVAEQAARAAGVVRNLLSFARKREPEKEHASVNAIVRKAIELKEYELRVSGIGVRTELDPSLPMTMLDSNQMSQVLVNLMTNAEQTMVEARIPGTIQITTRARAGRIQIELSDEGPGIPAESLPRLFEPFFSTKEVGRGTGLGLSICYGIVQEHGGSISVENRRGGGACFTVDLPIVGPQESGATAAVASRTKAAEAGAAAAVKEIPPSSQNGFRVLLVDDEPMILDIYYQGLTRAGYDVVTATNGQTALKRLAEARFHVVVTDLMMPRMGGMELAASVAASHPDLAEKVIFMTGDVASDPRRKYGIPAGARLLEKPFTHEDLLEAISSLCEPSPAAVTS